MPTDSKAKTFHYARASYVREPRGNANLQKMIGQAFGTLVTMPKRSVKFRDGRVVLPNHQRLRTNKAGSLLHLTTYMQDERATTVPHPSPRETEKDLGSVVPPLNEDFMDGEAFLLVAANHVVICASSPLSDSMMCAYFDKLFQGAGIVTEPLGISFQRVADLNYIEMIQKFGVKSITLNASIYESSSLRINRELNRGRILGNFYEQLEAMISEDEPVAHSVENADLLTKVTIRLPPPTRQRGAEKTLAQLTENLISEEGEDSVEIELGNGALLSSKRVSLSKVFRVKQLHKGLDHFDAWEHLDGYLEELRVSHLLEN